MPASSTGRISSPWCRAMQVLGLKETSGLRGQMHTLALQAEQASAGASQQVADDWPAHRRS